MLQLWLNHGLQANPRYLAFLARPNFLLVLFFYALITLDGTSVTLALAIIVLILLGPAGVLEKKLSKKHFSRANRSVIVNNAEIKSYSHWENEKYILLLKTGKEIVVTRKRIVALKKVLS